MTVAPRPAVDEAVEMAAGWGLHPDVVDIAGNDPEGGSSLNLAPHEPVAAGSRPGGALWFSLTGLAVVLAAVAVSSTRLPLRRPVLPTSAVSRSLNRKAIFTAS